MIQSTPEQRKLRVLITVKTYPIPSSKYDELVCTAGVTETGDFVRLYPINFRDLPDDKQFTKYQWIEVKASKHTGRDKRPESYRPDSESIEICGDPIKTKPGNWRDRSRYVLKNKAKSIEYLRERQKSDKTSLGIFKPKNISDLVIKPDSSRWNPKFIAELEQQRIWEDRTVSRKPPRKVPFKFIYKFHNYAFPLSCRNVCGGFRYQRSPLGAGQVVVGATCGRKRFISSDCLGGRFGIMSAVEIVREAWGRCSMLFISDRHCPCTRTLKHPGSYTRVSSRGYSSVGRAPESHSGGQRFDSA